MNLVKKAKEFIEGQRNIKITLQFDELSDVTIKLRSEKRREKIKLNECTNPFKKKIEPRLKDVEIDDEALTYITQPHLKLRPNYVDFGLFFGIGVNILNFGDLSG